MDDDQIFKGGGVPVLGVGSGWTIMAYAQAWFQKKLGKRVLSKVWTLPALEVVCSNSVTALLAGSLKENLQTNFWL